MAKTDTPDPSALAPIDYGSPLTDADAWFNEPADDVAGYDLVKEDALFSLIGVPFRVFTLTYRPGNQQPKIEWRNDYVSAETRVFPAPIILRDWDRIMSRRTGKGRERVKDARAIPAPGEQLVVNDGSTGVFRQSVEYLEAKELITVPEADHAGNAMAKTGPKNECRYDLPSSYWTLNEDAVRAGVIEQRYTPTGEALLIFHVRLNCTRGLRYSDYENPSNKSEQAVTFYIA